MDETFGYVLRRRRAEKGWSVSELARRAGVHRVSIWEWEHDRCFPRYPYRLALRVALGLSDRDDDGWWHNDRIP